MGFRFRKSIPLARGLRLNLSKSGVSASFGRPGATVNLGRRGVTGTAGLPGTGLSYQSRLDRRRGGTAWVAVALALLIAALWRLG